MEVDTDRISQLETTVKQLVAANLKVRLSIPGRVLVIYSLVTHESIDIPITKKHMQFLFLKFPGLRDV